MKALTLTQPWATLIAIGAKRIETRSWNTEHRGLLAIHAAKGLSSIGGKQGLVEQCEVPAFKWAFITYPPLYSNHQNPLPLGTILAVAKLADVQRIDLKLRAEVLAQTITPNEIEFGLYESGRYAWFLEEVRPLPEPIPCKGTSNLWDVPSEIADRIEKYL